MKHQQRNCDVTMRLRSIVCSAQCGRSLVLDVSTGHTAMIVHIEWVLLSEILNLRVLLAFECIAVGLAIGGGNFRAGKAHTHCERHICETVGITQQPPILFSSNLWSH